MFPPRQMQSNPCTVTNLLTLFCLFSQHQSSYLWKGEQIIGSKQIIHLNLFCSQPEPQWSRWDMRWVQCCGHTCPALHLELLIWFITSIVGNKTSWACKSQITFHRHLCPCAERILKLSFENHGQSSLWLRPHRLAGGCWSNRDLPSHPCSHH